MPRPRQSSYAESAAGRIEAAFWRILEQDGFEAVTIARLAQESGCNRNTVYYHFCNIQELVQAAFRHSFPESESRLFAEMLLSDKEIAPSPAESAQLYEHLRKFHLFAKSGAPLLISILQDALRQTWFALLGIEASRVSPTDRLQVQYLLGGFISLIASRDVMRDFSLLKAFPHTSIGQAALRTLQQIAARQRTEP